MEKLGNSRTYYIRFGIFLDIMTTESPSEHVLCIVYFVILVYFTLQNHVIYFYYYYYYCAFIYNSFIVNRICFAIENFNGVKNNGEKHSLYENTFIYHQLPISRK